MITAQMICYAAIRSIMIVFWLCRLLTLRRSFLLTAAGLAAITVLICYAVYGITGKDGGVLEAALNAASGFGYTMLTFRDSPRAKAAAYLSGLLMSLVALCCGQLTAHAILGSAPVTATSRMLFHDMFMILVLSVLAAVKHRTGERIRLLLMMLLFSALHLAFLIIFFITCGTADSEVNCLMQLCFQLLLFALITVQYFNSMRIAELERREAEVRRFSEEMEDSRRYFMLADSKFSEISRIRHDIQNHLSTARLLMEGSDSISSAESIIDAIEQRLDNI